MVKRVHVEAEPDSIQFIAEEGGDVALVFDYVRIPDEATNVRLTLKLRAAEIDGFAESLRLKLKESLERKLPN
jgi:hypothetical protein